MLRQTEQDLNEENQQRNHQLEADALEEIKNLVRLCKFGVFVLLWFNIAAWFVLFQILLK